MIPKIKIKIMNRTSQTRFLPESCERERILAISHGDGDGDGDGEKVVAGLKKNKYATEIL